MCGTWIVLDWTGCFSIMAIKLVQLYPTVGQNSKPFSPTKPKPKPKPKPNANAKIVFEYVDQNTQTKL